MTALEKAAQAGIYPGSYVNVDLRRVAIVISYDDPRWVEYWSNMNLRDEFEWVPLVQTWNGNVNGYHASALRLRELLPEPPPILPLLCPSCDEGSVISGDYICKICRRELTRLA